MTEITVRRVVEDAREFLKRAQAVLEVAKTKDMLFYKSAEAASLRRQSMELTRSLAELRKP